MPESVQVSHKAARYRPSLALEAEFRRQIREGLDDVEDALKVWAPLYEKYLDKMRTFEGDSLRKGMSWSGIVGGVGLGLLAECWVGSLAGC